MSLNNDPFCYTSSCCRYLVKHEKLRRLWCLRYVHVQIHAEDACGAPHRGKRDQTRCLVPPQWGHQPSEAIWGGLCFTRKVCRFDISPLQRQRYASIIPVRILLLCSSGAVFSLCGLSGVM